MSKYYSLLKIGLLVLMVGLIVFGCRSKEVESALIYINQQNDWEKAMEQLKIAVEINPADTEAHLLLGEGYGHYGEYDKMVEEFATVEKLMAGSPNKKFQERIEFLREKYWRISFNTGVANVREEKLDEAKTNFEDCVLIDPGHTESYKNLAYVNIRQDAVDAAIENYNKVVELNPDDVEVLSSLANLYLTTQQYEKCIKTADKILAIQPDNISAIAQKAMSYDLLEESEKAFQAYEEALERDPENRDLIFNLGRLLYQRGDYQGAIQRFVHVLEASPDDYEANINVGNAYLLMAEEVIKKYRDMDDKQLRKVEQEFEADNETAREYYKKSIPYLEKAIALNMDRTTGWYNLGVAYAQAGDGKKAELCFKIADDVGEGNFLKASEFIDEYLSHLK
ncbi:MAG TPA: tetratricopeptide repeat protein [bacterium]|nr:tetratricopeptide repeat protein [bacterium]